MRRRAWSPARLRPPPSPPLHPSTEKVPDRTIRHRYCFSPGLLRGSRLELGENGDAAVVSLIALGSLAALQGIGRREDQRIGGDLGVEMRLCAGYRREESGVGRL